MGIYVGLDIGGTKFMAATADKTGQILKRTRATSSNDLAKDLTTLNNMIQEIAVDETILSIGAAVGGPLDWQTGMVSPLHQPAWRNVPLKDILQNRWNCPVSLDVDTNIAALGEYYSTQDFPDRFLYLTMSTGMGGGFLVDGKVYRGANGSHPEIAHQAIPFRCSHPSRVRCECGAPGCLEALISGNGIRRVYQKPAEALNGEEWSEVAHNLGLGLRNITVILAPEVISMGGGVAIGGGEKLVDQARQVMRENLHLVPAPEVRLSTLGYDTALVGAIEVAIHGIEG